MDISKKVEELIKSGAIPEPVLQALIGEWDPIIHVDRSTPPKYPDFVKKIQHPELELKGPAKFDIAKIELWGHPDQIWVVSGNEIYKCLKEEKLLESCCNLADLKAIQARGAGFFNKHFAGKVIFGWGSVALDCHDDRLVPCLCWCVDGVVELRWYFISNDNYDWYSNSPALLRPS